MAHTGTSWVGTSRTNLSDAILDLTGKVEIFAGTTAITAGIDAEPRGRKYQAYVVYY